MRIIIIFLNYRNVAYSLSYDTRIGQDLHRENLFEFEATKRRRTSKETLVHALTYIIIFSGSLKKCWGGINFFIFL